jgi:hypothetical protein
MRSYLRAFGLAVAAAGLCCVAQAAPANAAGCYGFSGTADGFDKITAVTRAQAAVADAIKQYKAQKKIRSVTVSAMRASPQPYWRDSVSADLYYKPDIVNADSYTICWHGVVSPYVCTSGAKACW